MNNSMQAPRPVVVAPTSIEYAVVRQALQPWLTTGKLTLAQCGMGPQLAQAFGEGLSSDQVSCIILLGWAGGLVANLKVGNFICADKAVRMDWPSLNCRPVQISTAITGPILTVSKALLRPEEKRQAQSSGALAVEMEAYPLAVKAEKLGIPFVHARIILDTVNESIPEFSAGINAAGKIELRSFLSLLLRRPALIKEMWKLNLRIRSLNPALGQLARNIMTALLPE